MMELLLRRPEELASVKNDGRFSTDWRHQDARSSKDASGSRPSNMSTPKRSRLLAKVAEKERAEQVQVVFCKKKKKSTMYSTNFRK